MAMKACSVAPTSLFTIFFIFVSVLIVFSNAKSDIPGLYIFGDSITDVGNNNYLYISLNRANFPPYGIDFPTKQPTGRFCNGKNAADFLAERLKLPSPPPYLSLVSKVNTEKDSFVAGVNFASGGAGILNSTDVKYSQGFPLTEQVHYYTQVCAQLQQHLGPEASKVHLENALTVIFLGHNDLLDYLSSPIIRNKYTPDQFINIMLSSFGENLQKIYNLGARKFLFLGTLPVGCLPVHINYTGDCNELGNSMSAKFSKGMSLMIQKLEKSVDLNYVFINTHRILLDMIQKPSSYGFSETKAACCGHLNAKFPFPCVPISYICPNRKDHIFWDLSHPTEETHGILVELLWEDPTSSYSFPMSVKEFVSPSF